MFTWSKLFFQEGHEPDKLAHVNQMRTPNMLTLAPINIIITLAHRTMKERNAIGKTDLMELINLYHSAREHIYKHSSHSKFYNCTSLHILFKHHFLSVIKNRMKITAHVIRLRQRTQIEFNSLSLNPLIRLCVGTFFYSLHKTRTIRNAVLGFLNWNLSTWDLIIGVVSKCLSS